MAQLRADPAAAGTNLTAILQADTLTKDAAKDFKDLQSLAGLDPTPETLDWIGTFKIGAAAPPVAPDMTGSALDRARTADPRCARAREGPLRRKPRPRLADRRIGPHAAGRSRERALPGRRGRPRCDRAVLL